MEDVLLALLLACTPPFDEDLHEEAEEVELCEGTVSVPYDAGEGCAPACEWEVGLEEVDACGIEGGALTCTGRWAPLGEGC